MKTIFSILDKRSSKYVWWLNVLTVIVLTLCSGFFWKTLFFEPFYIFPIIIAGWYGSRKSAMIFALASTFLLLSMNVIHAGFNVIVLLGYGLPYAVSFSILATLITDFRNVHRVESIAADTDNLTDIYNSRGFYVELANELIRSSRYDHSFSLVYIDIDHFKLINDSRGHSTGDQLLIEVANILKETLRKTDIIARLGGDEFACLLPESGQEEAKAAFSKASKLLTRRMYNNKWPVTFSVGIVTFETAPADIKEAMKVADELMYSVKNLDKNDVSYKIWHGKA